MAIPGAASAQLTLDRLWVDFNNSKELRADIALRNESSDTYYITITPSEILNAGTDKETRASNTDPDKLGLLVTPNRLVVKPGEGRSIRIVSLNQDLKADRIYRVKITPQVGSIEDEKVDPNSHGMAIKLLSAYDVLVTVRPNSPDARLAVNRTATELVIRNVGNSNVLLFDGKSCPGSDAADKPAVNKPTDCTKIGSRRLYVGNEWHLPLHSATEKFQFTKSTSAQDEPSPANY